MGNGKEGEDGEEVEKRGNLKREWTSIWNMMKG